MSADALPQLGSGRLPHPAAIRLGALIQRGGGPRAPPGRGGGATRSRRYTQTGRSRGAAPAACCHADTVGEGQPLKIHGNDLRRRPGTAAPPTPSHHPAGLYPQRPPPSTPRWRPTLPTNPPTQTARARAWVEPHALRGGESGWAVLLDLRSKSRKFNVSSRSSALKGAKWSHGRRRLSPKTGELEADLHT